MLPLEAKKLDKTKCTPPRYKERSTKFWHMRAQNILRNCSRKYTELCASILQNSDVNFPDSLNDKCKPQSYY